MEKIRWPGLAADDLLFFLTRSLFPPPVCLQPCLSSFNVSWESESVLQAQSCLLLHFPFPDNLAPSVSSTLFDSPSGCTSTSPLPLILSMVTPLTPIAVRYTSKAHTHWMLSITCKSAFQNNGRYTRPVLSLTHSCCQLFSVKHIPESADSVPIQTVALKCFHIEQSFSLETPGKMWATGL